MHGEAYIYVVLLTAVIAIGVILAAIVEIEKRDAEKRGHSVNKKTESFLNLAVMFEYY